MNTKTCQHSPSQMHEMDKCMRSNDVSALSLVYSFERSRAGEAPGFRVPTVLEKDGPLVSN